MRIWYYFITFIVLIAVIVAMGTMEALSPGSGGEAAKTVAVDAAMVIAAAIASMVVADAAARAIRAAARWLIPRCDATITFIEMSRISLPSWLAIAICGICIAFTLFAFTSAFGTVNMQAVIADPVRNVHHFYVALGSLAVTVIVSAIVEALHRRACCHAS